MLLADYAVVSDGKLTIVGGGWSQTGPEPAPFGIGLLIQVPWDQANTPHSFRGELLAADGGLAFPLAMNSTPLPLEPGRYEWRLTIDGEARQDWSLAFTVRGEEA